jgi:hypothetical protein
MKSERVSRGRGNGKRASSLMIGAVAAGAMGLAALASAGTANASCASFGGNVTIGKGCTTTNRGDVAIGLGKGTVVNASGGFNTGIAIGPRAAAYSVGSFNTAIAVGRPGPNPGFDPVITPGPDQRTFAGAYGNFNRSLSFGRGTIADSFGGGTWGPNAVGNNTAISIGRGSNSLAGWTTAPTNDKFSVAVGTNNNAYNGINNEQ